VVSFTPRPLYLLGKNPQYPLGRKLGGSQSWSGRSGERKFLTLTGLEIRPFGRPARSQSLYRLRYPGSLYVIVYIVKVSTFAFTKILGVSENKHQNYVHAVACLYILSIESHFQPTSNFCSSCSAKYKRILSYHLLGSTLESSMHHDVYILSFIF
jgi:hypothetical protein